MARRFLLALGFLLVSAQAASAAELQAAFDYYQPGQGFQIGLVNAASGAPRPLPAGVNTADDELHPALSPDGRWLVFTRMRILPKLDGTFVVPAERHLVAADLQAQTIVPIPAGAGGAGSTFMGNGTSQPDLAWGITPETGSFEGNTRVARSLQLQQLPAGTASGLNTDLNGGVSPFVPHAGVMRAAFTSTLFENRLCPTATPCNSPRDIRYFTFARFDSAGAFGASTVRMQLTGVPDHMDTTLPKTLNAVDIGAPDQPAGHPVARITDHIAALDRNTGADSDIHTIQFPAETTTTPAPAPITTTADERMPSWSPDGLQLAFVRTVNGRRKLGVYDLTPGIQAITNGLVDLGPEAPTSQTNTFQNVWGGLSLAKLPAAPAVTCDARCIAGLRNVGVLTPIVTGVGTNIGIFVVKRTGGTHKVLGVKQPRIKAVGKFPLGKAKQGRNRLGELSKRLKPGKYLVTYRLLRGTKVTSVSNSIPVTIKR